MSETRHRGPRYFAACTLGLEEVLAEELRGLGASGIEVGRGGAHFVGDRELGYRAALWLRTAIRVQELLAEGQARDKRGLYDLARAVDWSASVTPRTTLAVDATVRDSFARDTRLPALVVKDAVVDQIREREGARPDVDRTRPDLPIKLVLLGRHARIYRDLAGASLHKRGYRDVQVKSPLNEALAAGMLLLSEWDRSSPLLDPMCGSGTLCIEACWLAGDRAPGLGRRFPFVRWPDFARRPWQRLLAEAERRASAGASRIPPIQGADRHGGALSIARRSAAQAGVERHVTFVQSEVRDLRPDPVPAVVVVNPPYGERLGDAPDLEATWQDLGAFLRQRCLGAVAFVLCGAPELSRHLRLRADRKWPLRNGPIDCRLLRYEVAGG